MQYVDADTSQSAVRLACRVSVYEYTHVCPSAATRCLFNPVQSINCLGAHRRPPASRHGGVDAVSSLSRSLSARRVVC